MSGCQIPEITVPKAPFLFCGCGAFWDVLCNQTGELLPVVNMNRSFLLASSCFEWFNLPLVFPFVFLFGIRFICEARVFLPLQHSVGLPDIHAGYGFAIGKSQEIVSGSRRFVRTR